MGASQSGRRSEPRAIGVAVHCKWQTHATINVFVRRQDGRVEYGMVEYVAGGSLLKAVHRKKRRDRREVTFASTVAALQAAALTRRCARPQMPARLHTLHNMASKRQARPHTGTYTRRLSTGGNGRRRCRRKRTHRNEDDVAAAGMRCVARVWQGRPVFIRTIGRKRRVCSCIQTSAP